MAFEEVVGQERVINHFKQALKNNRVSHAYLIEGLNGIGKGFFAISLAKAILCHSREERPCGECSSCRKIKDNNHPELHIVQRDGNIKIEDIREIQKQINIKPYEGYKKVFIIFNGEKMTHQAQNALLKTLEEPPGHSIIILTTANSKNLLPTISSRCQLLKLRPQGIEVIKIHLIKKLGISEEEAKILATFSNGLIGKALKLYKDEEFKVRREKVIDITQKLLSAKTIDILSEVEFFAKEKDHIEEIIDLLIYWYRDILVYCETYNDHLIINLDQMKSIKKQVEKASTLKIKKIILMLEEKKQQVKGNANYSLAMEVMLLNMQEVLA